MKRFTALLLGLTLAAGALTGCSQNVESKETTTAKATEAETTTEAAAYKGPEGTLAEIIDKIYASKDTGMMLTTTDLDLTATDMLTYNTGLKDASKIKEAAVSEPMMSVDAYSLVVVRVNDPADTEAVANEMLNGIDQAKWICAQADDLKVATSGDTILLVMLSSNLKETVTAEQLVEAFKTVCEGNQDLVLEK